MIFIYVRVGCLSHDCHMTFICLMFRLSSEDVDIIPAAMPDNLSVSASCQGADLVAFWLN